MSEFWSEKTEERPTFKWICTAVNRLIKDTKVETVTDSDSFLSLAFISDYAFAASKPRPALSRLGQGDGGMADSKRLF